MRATHTAHAAELALARCERERINLTDVLRGFLAAWADEEHDDT